MIVVADTTPLNYLVLIGHIDVLHLLYSDVIIPPAVYMELLNPKTPATVRAWADVLPSWVEIRTPGPISSEIQIRLGLGELEAISLAQTYSASLLLIDEIRGRREATRLGIPIAGTLGILQQAHRKGLLEIRAAIAHLKETSFQASEALFEQAIRNAEQT